MKKGLIIIFSILICSVSQAQLGRIKLNKEIFEKQIKNKAWSLEDSSKIASNEMFLVNFMNDSISLAYIDWIELMSAIYSVYKTKFRNDCVEIKPKKWKSLIGPIDKFKRPKPFRIYCYLKNNSALVLMFSEKQLDMDDTLINKGDWFVLELIKD